MNDNATPTQRTAEKVEIAIHIDSEVLEQIKHLTNDAILPYHPKGNGMTKIFQSLIGYFPTERLKYFLRSTIDSN